VLNRADSRVGISADDVTAVLGHAPDILVPSDREVPRALNEGQPIVMSRKQSAVARSFRQLAAAVVASATAARAPAPAEPKSESRRVIGRRR
jgi:pilus assembly protein CpaE